MQTVILLNGPPGCGKDTAANHIGRTFGWVALMKFATHVKEGTHALLGLFDEKGRPLKHDYFESVKNNSMHEFGGMSPRQAYIWFSEEVMKPKFGKSVFGKIEANKLPTTAARLYVFSDSGFASEALEIVKAVGAENVRLVNIYRDGCDFTGDSRSYLTARDVGIPEANRHGVFNDGTDAYLALVTELVSEIAWSA